MNLAAHLEELERELLAPAVRRNSSRLEELLAVDFREVGASGRTYDRSAIITALLQEEPQTISLADLSCAIITAECAMLTYQSRRTNGAEPYFVRRISVWILRESRWQMLYHQGTREFRD